MSLEDALALIRPIIKQSEALDQFQHVDLTLVAAQERPKYQQALVLLAKALREGLITAKDLEKQTQLKV